MTIYDGGSSSSPMIGKYCGTLIPHSHVSSSNDILIDFHSDGVETRPGFKIEYNPKGTVVCKIVHKFVSVWCKTALGEVGVSLP